MQKYNSVGCYVRVSTENQIENYSIEEQIDRLKAFCKAKDLNIYKFYIDGGYSGGNIDRPALIELLNDIKLKKLTMIIVYKLDRLSRSQKDTLNLIEDQFLANNVNFLSVLENFDTSTAFGKAMIGILSVFSQLEKDQITERFAMGRIGRSKSGLYHGGSSAPTGYDYINGKLVVNKFKAKQIKEIYNKFLLGYTINYITNYMHNKYGGYSSHSLISKILKNSVYIGKVKFNGIEYDGLHDPIITDDVYFKVQKLLNERTKNICNNTPFKASYLLSGLIFCSQCKSKYSANHGFYKCYSRSKSNKKYITNPNCKNKNWKIEELDSIIINCIKNLSIDTDALENLISKKYNIDNDSQHILKERINEIDKQINRLVNLYQVNSISLEYISKNLSILQKEKETLNCNFEKSCEKNHLNIKNLNNFETLFKYTLLEENRLIVKNLIKEIWINNNKIDIHWNF